MTPSNDNCGVILLGVSCIDIVVSIISTSNWKKTFNGSCFYFTDTASILTTWPASCCRRHAKYVLLRTNSAWRRKGWLHFVIIIKDKLLCWSLRYCWLNLLRLKWNLTQLQLTVPNSSIVWNTARSSRSSNSATVATKLQRALTAPLQLFLWWAAATDSSYFSSSSFSLSQSLMNWAVWLRICTRTVPSPMENCTN